MREIGYARRKVHIAESLPEGTSETHMVAEGLISGTNAAVSPDIRPSLALCSLALDRESWWLLHHMSLDTELCQSRIYRDRWLPICLFNSAVFYQMLTTYATHIVLDRPDQDLKRFILSSHAKALAGVRASLSSLAVLDKRILNGIVCAIAALACYSHLEGDVVSWKLHMAAVYRLVKESGFGLAELDGKVIDVVQWVESTGSYAYDIRPEQSCAPRAISHQPTRGGVSLLEWP
ncbi:hypothetical protein BJX64DRAFT_229200 [Aspergillus heterothallicus]